MQGRLQLLASASVGPGEGEGEEYYPLGRDGSEDASNLGSGQALPKIDLAWDRVD